MFEKITQWIGWERFDEGWHVRMTIKHIDRYDPSNQGQGRIDVRNERQFRGRFPGSYGTVRKAYPDLPWADIFYDIGYMPAEVTADGYPILVARQLMRGIRRSAI